ncbi:VWA domain-containing protein [Oceanibium sediminis]|uniref:VWA domain-containing protein n=1 Tax=Oceanibium sediminis TaxID=2026339 RepID=UPI000DD4EA11|nr:VWA domain-containing protein [Oceanibium sediminis]
MTFASLVRRALLPALALAPLPVAVAPVAAQSNTLFNAVRDAGPALRDEPGLQSGATPVEIATPAQTAFFWLDVPENGLYDIALSGPGALTLFTFPNAEGLPDGDTRPAVAAYHGSSLRPAALDSILLAAGRPVLLAASSLTPVSLSFDLDTPLGAAQPAPQEGAALSPGSYLFQPDPKLSLTLPASRDPLDIRVTFPPGTEGQAAIGRQSVLRNGLTPLSLEDPGQLALSVRTADGVPPPLALVSIAKATPRGAERETPDDLPNTLSLGTPFQGTLLAGDKDTIDFTIAEDAALDLSVLADMRWPRYSLSLAKFNEDNYPEALWQRESEGGAIGPQTMHLGAGTYRLQLARVDTDEQATGYTLTLKQASPAPTGQEREPNNTPIAAMPLPETWAVRGALRPDDNDHIRFSIPDDSAERLWRLIAVGVEQMRLNGQGGEIRRADAAGPRATMDALRLTPGDYVVELRGDGPYALRLLDLGAADQGYEGEPNDAPATGRRLAFGAQIEGTFGDASDMDYVLFHLDRESTVALSVAPADDGPMSARLFLEGAQWGNDRAFQPGDAPYTYRATLPAGEWQLRLRSGHSITRGTYRVALERAVSAADGEANDHPADTLPFPLDGDLSGGLGAFDGADHALARLPEGAGSLLIACDAPENMGFSWRAFRFSDGERLDNPNNGLLIVDYPADDPLGGGVQLSLAGQTTPFDYSCAQRFAPGALDLPESGSAEGLSPGSALRLTVNEAAERYDIPLDLAPGQSAAFACRDEGGAPVGADADVWRLRNVSVLRALLGDLTVLRAGQDAQLQLRGNRFESLPATLSCHLYGLDDLPRPADMGPLAPLEPGPESGVPGAARDALLALAPPPEQPDRDLPVSVTFATPPVLAAYAQSGQMLDLRATLANDGETPLELTLAAEPTNAGWRAEVSPQVLSLAPGARPEVAITAEVPPWQSPVAAPSLVLRAGNDTGTAGGLLALPVDPLAAPVAPMVFWDAPEGMRGGLNLLHAGLGARLVAVDGKALSEKEIQDHARLHDGIAPHAGAKVTGKTMDFALAAPAELAGVMVQLRSTNTRDTWPSEMTVETSDDGQSWTSALSAPLAAIHWPQYLPFDTPKRAAHLRVSFPRCAQDCSRVTVQEVQAIAVPGQHPEGLGDINIASPALGGHVIDAQPVVSGAWNVDVLQIDERNRGWTARGAPHVILVGFHQNRAALINRIRWVGHEDDAARPEGATVEYSLTSPAGPWQPIGTLPAPPVGSGGAGAIDLPDPLWVRYLRVTVPIEGDQRGPDAIEVYEEPGQSAIALWEDDSPRGAYEAVTKITPPQPVAPAGGESRDRAVPYRLGTTVESSVLLERNEDWWSVAVPDGPPQVLTLTYPSVPLEVAVQIEDTAGEPVPLSRGETEEGTVLSAVLAPGSYLLRVYEPPRSVVIAWDTSGSVSAYIPRTLAAVRTWGESLQPGRDVIQLLPFGSPPLLADWASTPEELAPALRRLPEPQSSDSEGTLTVASELLSDRLGAHGVVIITDAETSPVKELWPALLAARPRVVSLSVDSDSRQNAAIMMDWANLNGGRFQRVIGPLGLADGMDMAAALFRAPKGYRMASTLEPYVEPEGEVEITIAGTLPVAEQPAPSGAIEVILDASGSMLQRLNGERRIAIAHDALARLVERTLPEGTPFAFRAFGLQEDACRTELRLPLAPLDRDVAAAEIRGVPAINLAKTAIADSLLAAGADLAHSSAPRVIVLVTDGEETCDGNPEAAIRSLRDSGLDVRVNIVGFAIDDADLARTFADWAKAGGGAYFDAGDAEALSTAVESALIPRFDVVRSYLDGTSEVVGTISLGETAVMPAGLLTIRPGSAATGAAQTLRLLPGEAAAFDYTAEEGLSTP